MPNVGYAALQVIPTMKGAESALATQLVPAATTAGAKAGTAAGTSMRTRLVKAAAVTGGVGKSLTKAFTVPLVGLGVAAFASADKVADAHDQIKVATGKTGKSLKGLQDIFDSVAKKTPASFDTVAQAVSGLAQTTGASGKTLHKLSLDVIEGSRVMGEDGAKNAKLFGQTLNQANIPARDGDKLLNKLFTASQKYGVGLGETMKNLKKFGPQMKSAGLSMDQTIDLFGKFNKAGVSANRIVPSLNAAMIKWGKAGKDPAKMLQNLSKKIKGANSDQEAFKIASKDLSGPGASAFVNAMRKKSVSLDGLGESLKKGEKSITETGKNTKTFKEQMSQLGNVAKLSLAPLGEKLIPLVTKAIKSLAPKLEAAADWFTNLSSGGKKFVLIATGILAAIGPVLSIFSKVIGVAMKVGKAIKVVSIAMKALNLTFLTSPIGILVVALVALGAAFVVLWKKSETFRKIVKGAWTGIKKTALAVWNWFKNTLWPGIKKVWDKISSGFVATKDAIEKAWKKIKGAFKAAWNWVKGTFKSWWNGLKKIVTWPIDKAKDAIKTGWSNIKHNFRAAWNWVKGTFKGLWNGVENILKKPIKAIKGFLKREVNGWKAVFRGAKSAIGKIWDGMKSVITKPINGIISAINSFLRGINNIANKIPGVSLHIPMIPKLGGGGSVSGRAGGGRHLAPAFANGGTISGPWKGPKADNVLGVSSAGVPVARVNPGEYVTNVAATRKMQRNYPGALEHINRTGRLPGFGIGGWIGGAIGGVKDVVTGAWDKAKSIAGALLHPIKWMKKHLLNPLLDSVGNSLPATFIKGFAKWAVGKVGDMFSFGGGAEPKGSGVQRWKPYVKKALAMNGLPATGRYVSAWLRQIATESGGNPKIHQQIQDINSFLGHPAQGLLQTIPSTFNAYKFPGHGRILNGFDNMLAAINYAIHAYGRTGMLKVIGHGHGYDSGGLLQPGSTLAVNKTGKPEAVLTNTQWKTLQSVASGGHASGGPVDLSDRTLSRLADAVASQVIEMDGHTVARIMAGYTGQDRASARIAGAGSVSA